MYSADLCGDGFIEARRFTELKLAIALAVAVDGSRVGTRQADGARNERRENLGKVERRADRLPDLLQRGKLLDRARKLRRAFVQLGEQTRVLDRNYRLRRKALQDFDFLLGEKSDLLSCGDDLAEQPRTLAQRNE